MGDFNCEKDYRGSAGGNLKSGDLLQVLQDNFPIKIVTEPIKGENILDLTLTTDGNMINEVENGIQLVYSNPKEKRFTLDQGNS